MSKAIEILNLLERVSFDDVIKPFVISEILQDGLPYQVDAARYITSTEYLEDDKLATVFKPTGPLDEIIRSLPHRARRYLATYGTPVTTTKPVAVGATDKISYEVFRIDNEYYINQLNDITHSVSIFGTQNGLVYLLDNSVNWVMENILPDN